jgi:hypothetical protein
MADRANVLAGALSWYAATLLDQGEVARAAPIATESLALFRARENRYGIGDCLGTLGRLALLQGDLPQAHRHFHEVVTLATTFNLRMTQCQWQPLLGLVTLYDDNAAAAHRLLNESLHLCLELKNKFFLARVCTYLAEAALWAGALEQAEQWLAQSLAYHADPHRITIYELERLWVVARVATAQQHYQQAATLFGLADQAHSRIHYVYAGPVRALAEAALATVRAALDPAVFAKAFAVGQQLSLSKAFATILTPADGVGMMTGA